MNILWQWGTFEDLSKHEIFEVLRLRQSVFIVEQACAYQDIDFLDLSSWHLLAWCRSERSKELVAYCRVTYPEQKYLEPSIGRVVTTPSIRGNGLGKKLMQEAIVRTHEVYPGNGIRISAQAHLKDFYSGFGFISVSTPYDEDGIPHIEMLLTH